MILEASVEFVVILVSTAVNTPTLLLSPIESAGVNCTDSLAFKSVHSNTPAVEVHVAVNSLGQLLEDDDRYTAAERDIKAVSCKT